MFNNKKKNYKEGNMYEPENSFKSYCVIQNLLCEFGQVG